MNELAQHIEILLLENDCVIVPGFGGFIAHNMPSVWLDDENMFLPPTRTIGFNPQLKMNDGVLVQSYMETYDTNFSDATKVLDKDVTELLDCIHENGSAELLNIGRIDFSIHGLYIFSPYDNRVTSPSLYGLDSFEMKALKVLRMPDANKSVRIPERVEAKKTFEIKINRALVRNAVAAVAAIILFFYMSTPIENTYVEKANYAQLLPSELFSQIEGQSLITSSVAASLGMKEANDSQQQTATINPKVIKPVAVKEIKVPKSDEGAIKKEEVKAQVETTKPAISVSKEIVKKSYYIIVASVTRQKDAEIMVGELKANGYPGAEVVTGDGKIRVSINSFSSSDEVTKQLPQIRQNDAYKNAWMLAK